MVQKSPGLLAGSVVPAYHPESLIEVEDSITRRGLTVSRMGNVKPKNVQYPLFGVSSPGYSYHAFAPARFSRQGAELSPTENDAYSARIFDGVRAVRVFVTAMQEEQLVKGLIFGPRLVGVITSPEILIRTATHSSEKKNGANTSTTKVGPRYAKVWALNVWGAIGDLDEESLAIFGLKATNRVDSVELEYAKIQQNLRERIIQPNPPLPFSPDD